jgi:riboflavin biosynthesis pyrimidine reductase
LKVVQHFPTHKELQLDGIDDAANFYPEIQGLRFNYVIQVGKTEANSDLSTSEADRFFLKVIRSQSDLIVTTGATARSEALKASKYAPLLLLTKQDELHCPATQLQSEQKVFVTLRGQRFENANAEAVGSTTEPLISWLENFMLEQDFQKAVVETGLTVTRELLAMDLAEEFCLSVTDATDSTEATAFANATLEKLGLRPALLQLIEAENTFLFRFDLTKEIQR